MEAKTGCLVCDKHSGLIPVPGGCLYEDELVYASHIFPRPGDTTTVLGTLSVEVKRHVPGVIELTDEEGERIGRICTRLSRALKQSAGVEKVYLHVWGDGVAHFHMWLVPRYPGTPKEYWPMVESWPDAPRGDAADVAALCDRLRTFI